MKSEGLSRYKFKKIAVESLRNSLRLHFDSMLLYGNESYPSAFQLSVLSLEEFAKAKWVEHYISSAETNTGYPDAKFEQEWLQLLYRHLEKQWAFIAREIYDYSPKFAQFIKDNKLEEKKQNATYVGLSRAKGKIDIASHVSTPDRIKEKDVRQIISLINSEFLEICKAIEEYEGCFDVRGMDDVFDYTDFIKLLKWPHSTKLSTLFSVIPKNTIECSRTTNFGLA